MRTKITFASLFVMLGAATAAQSQTMELVVPFGAGGGSDTVARVFERGFSAALDRTIVIRNIAGASGTIGAAAVAQASADGNTLGYIPIGPLAIQPSLRDTAYDLDSFDYICQTTSTPVFLLQSAGSDKSEVAEWVTQGADSRVVYGSSGPGTIPHIAMAAFATEADMNSVHLPFDGTGVAMNAMAGGEIDLFVDTATVMESYDVTALAVFSAERLESYPDISTMAELGYELEFSVWQGVVAPAGLDEAQKSALADACSAAVDATAFQELAAQTNTGLMYRGPEDFEAFVRSNAEVNAQILQDAGLTQ